MSARCTWNFMNRSIRSGQRSPRQSAGPRPLIGRADTPDRHPTRGFRRLIPRCPRAASAPRRCATRSSTSACRRCARATCRPSASTRWSRSTRCTQVCESCLLVQLEEYVTADESSASTPTSPRTRTRWVAHARRYVEMIDRALRPRPRQPGHGGREQRRLPAPALRGARHSGARHRARRERRRGRRGARDRRRSCEFFGRETAARARRRGPPRRPDRRQQRAGPRAGPQRLRRRHADCSRRTAW